MRTSFRQTIFATAAVIALPVLMIGAFPAGAAAGAGDPTVVHPETGNSPATTPAHPAGRRSAVAGIELRIANLRTRLAITPAQQADWEQFAQVMRDNARTIDETYEQRKKALPGLSAIENIQSYAQLTTEHSREVVKLVPVFQVLYDKMSDSQKRNADEVFRTDSSNHDQHRRG